ncbi:acetate--CoA ligase family protein [bacterium]|nr:acetate--CoA ligase family protein [bacterium]MCB2180379.1 acetate--CoA ligase family protein [bacterium]
MSELNAFFEPDSIVVVGASRNPEKLGYGVARNLIGSGYGGEIYLVNPSGGTLFDRPLYPSLEELPDGISLGVIVVPPKFVPETLKVCASKGIQHVIILTGGFKESGEEGAEIEAVCQQIAKENGIRVIGPNCIGVLDTHAPLDTTFIQPPMPAAGEIAFITHSGALGAAMIDWARGQGFGFSRVISLGNQMDVNEADVLMPTAESIHTKVITLYLESVRDGSAFIQQARQASKRKPLLALKVGRSEAGQKAASSHTGALAGSDTAYEAAFRRSGVQRAETIEKMFMAAKTLAWCPMPNNPRVAILTNAGGPGVTAADAVDRNGLVPVALSQRTKTKLGDILPSAASVDNPVDMLASASPKVYGDCLQVLLDAPEVDMVLVIAPPPPMFEAVDIAEEIISRAHLTAKPVVASFMGSRLVEEGIARLRAVKIPEYAFPEDAVAALATLWRASEWQQNKDEEIAYQPTAGVREKVRGILDVERAGEEFASPEKTAEILRLYGLPILELVYASSAESAAIQAEQMGFPLVMKVAVKDISHKSDVGGILLNLHSAEEVRQGFRALAERMASLLPADEQMGVHLQRMAEKGQEVIIGAVRDPVFGPMVMFGSGGVEVEGLKDIRFAIAPLTESDLDTIVEETWAGRKLKGFRSYPAADRESVRTALIRLGQLMADFPEIQEVEINPLIVLGEGRGAFAVDARMMLNFQ